MSAADPSRQIDAENLAQARNMIQHVLRDWNLLRWNDLLAEDVVLFVRLGSVDFSLVGDLGRVGGDLQVCGREDATRVLKSIYDDLRQGLCVTTEIVSGYDVTLLGELSLESTKEGAVSDSWPITIYMKFDPYGMIGRMTIAAVDLQPMVNAIRTAAQNEKTAAANRVHDTPLT